MDSIRFQLALARHDETERRQRRQRLEALTGIRPTTAPPNLKDDALPKIPPFDDTITTTSNTNDSFEALSTPPPTPVKSPIADLERYEKMMLSEYE